MDSGYGAPVQQVEQTQTNIDLSGLSTDESLRFGRYSGVNLTGTELCLSMLSLSI